jgi:hypothetical protein
VRVDGASLALDLPSPVQARVPHRVQPNQPPLRPAAPGFTGAFPAYQDSQSRTGPQRQLGQPLRPRQPTGPLPVPGSAYQAQPHQAQHHQPRPGHPPFMGHPQQPQPDPAGYPGQRRPVLPYEVELPRR